METLNFGSAIALPATVNTHIMISNEASTATRCSVEIGSFLGMIEARIP